MKVAIIIFLVLAAVLSVFTLVAIIFSLLRGEKKSKEKEMPAEDSAKNTAK